MPGFARLAPALLLLAACGGGDAAETALSVPVIDTLPGGVVRVTNTGPTAWAGDVGWRFEQTATIAPAEGSPGELSDIAGLVTDDAGNVYVMQRQPALIKVYGPDGAWKMDIGREGDGPGEFRPGMLGLVGDTLIVQDPNNTRMTTFLTDGTFLDTHPSQCCWSTSRGLTSFDDGSVAILGPPADQESSSGAYFMTRPDGTVIDTVPMLPRDPNRDPDGAWVVRRTSGQSSSIYMTNIPGRPQDLSAFRRDRMIVRGNTATYELVLGRTFTDTARIIRAEAPELSLTDAQRDSLFDEAIEGVGESWREGFLEVAKRSDIPGTRPRWSALAVDDANRIWVGLPGPSSSVETIEVFSPEGVLLGRLAAPDPGILGGVFHGDRVVLRDESDLGLPIIRIFTLRRPSES
ncbi:MAG TPA: hypothetical protein PLI93_02660 [Gemmatimonadales bacterium]|nr:hypothetical protein [Gemmatimonadales bacterium]HRX17800.1 hypothetical protein [Gemmatimonadales bacterium]